MHHHLTNANIIELRESVQEKVEQIEEAPATAAVPTPQLRRPPSPPQSPVPAEEEVLAATPMPQLQEPSQPSPAVNPEPVGEKTGPAAEPLPQLRRPSQPSPAASPEPAVSQEPAEEKPATAAAPVPQLRRPKPLAPASKRDSEATSTAEPDPISVSILVSFLLFAWCQILEGPLMQEQLLG